MKKPLTAALLAFAIGAFSPAYAGGALQQSLASSAQPSPSTMLERLLLRGDTLKTNTVSHRRRCKTVCYGNSGTAGATAQYCLPKCN